MEHVFTLKYRAYDAIRANDQNWLALVTQYQVGHTCKNTIDDGIWFAGISGWGYSCGYANLAPCNGKTPNPGTGGGGGGDNRGTGDQGEGSGGDGSGVGTASSTGSGGGGGSSTAKNQSDKSKPLPKASAQGNAEQPELEPSPFFDGRQYKPGSEPDNLIISTISNASQTMIRNWPLALGTIVVVSPAGYFIWRRWK